MADGIMVLAAILLSDSMVIIKGQINRPLKGDHGDISSSDNFVINQMPGPLRFI